MGVFGEEGHVTRRDNAKGYLLGEVLASESHAYEGTSSFRDVMPYQPNPLINGLSSLQSPKLMHMIPTELSAFHGI
jgi:hypothetical protein